jgi:hypothetical protein
MHAMHLYRVVWPIVIESLVTAVVETQLTGREQRASGISPSFHIDPRELFVQIANESVSPLFGFSMTYQPRPRSQLH